MGGVASLPNASGFLRNGTAATPSCRLSIPIRSNFSTPSSMSSSSQLVPDETEIEPRHSAHADVDTPCSTPRILSPCIICMGRVSPSQQLTLVPCDHSLCAACALRLQPVTPKCPVCRTVIQSVVAVVTKETRESSHSGLNHPNAIEASNRPDNSSSRDEILRLSLEMLIAQKQSADEHIRACTPQIVIAGSPHIGKSTLVAKFRQLYPLNSFNDAGSDTRNSGRHVNSDDSQNRINDPSLSRPLAWLHARLDKAIASARRSRIQADPKFSTHSRHQQTPICPNTSSLSMLSSGTQRSLQFCNSSPSSHFQDAESMQNKHCQHSHCETGDIRVDDENSYYGTHRDTNEQCSTSGAVECVSELECRRYLESLDLESPFAPNTRVNGVSVRLSAFRLPPIKDKTSTPTSISDMIRSTLLDLRDKKLDFLMLACNVSNKTSFFEMLDWDSTIRSFSDVPLPPRFWIFLLESAHVNSFSPLTVDLRMDLGTALDKLPLNERPLTTAVLKPNDRFFSRRMRHVAERALHYAISRRRISK